MIALSAETEELVRRLAERSGKTPEQVVEDAVVTEAREASIVADAFDEARKEVDIDCVLGIVRRVSGRPLRDLRSAQDILEKAWAVER
jgi:hypothetical protein